MQKSSTTEAPRAGERFSAGNVKMETNMNAIVQKGQNALAALSSLKSGIQNVQQTMVRKSSDPYLRMLKDGAWVYGQEDLEVETGSLWAANPLSIEHGWTAWDRSPKADNSGGPLGEVMVPNSMPLPSKADLKDVGAEWSYQMSISFVCLNGTDKGEQVLYKANSVGATKAMDDLIKAISRQLDTDETRPVPIVRFNSSSYQHKQYGKTYEPVLDVVDWAPLGDELPAVDEPVKTDAAKPATKGRTRTVPATKAVEKAAPAADEDDEIARMEAIILAKKAAKDAATQGAAVTTVDPEAEAKAARKAALLAEMAALDGDAGGEAAQPETAQAAAPADGQPLRRRRNV